MARKQGFTLIELLIVIAIIGILAAVLIPNLLRGREVAQERAVLMHTKNVYLASIAYLAEDPNNAQVLGDCTHGITVGGYVIDDPKNSRISSCSVMDDDGDGSPTVVTIMTNGVTVSFP